MPQSDTMSQKSSKHKRSASGKLSNMGDQDLSMLRTQLNSEFDDGVLPVSIKFKLSSLFAQIEREFELLYIDNLNLHDKIETLLERLDRESMINEKFAECNDMECVNVTKSWSKQKVLTSNPSSQKLKTTNKLKVQTSKIVSSFKTSLLSCYKMKSFSGHRDGVWDIAVRPGQPVLGSASADRTARLWSTQTGKCLLQYSGHSGSVNSVRFLPNKDLVLSASGDQSVHIWQAVINWECLNNDNDSDQDEMSKDPPDESSITLRTPVQELLGHSSVVIAADWLADGEQVISASWDRVANLFDVETGSILQSLTGHDEELTFCASHPTQRLAVTCSKDTTFRLWDFRESIHSVCVFQGHTDTVTSAVFPVSGDEHRLVSGADDRTVKVWELRNMRAPLATIRTDSPVNRLSISPLTGLVAIPHDNRQVRLYDLSGARLGRLPRNNRQGHHRIVTATTWSDDTGLYTCGFDRIIMGWSVLQNKDKKQDGE